MSEVWVIIDIGGCLYTKAGFFQDEEKAAKYIHDNLDTERQKMYDEDSMYEPYKLKRYDS